MLATASLIFSLGLLEVAIRLLMPVYDPSGHLAFFRNQDSVTLAEPRFAGRQWKNTGDYDVAVRINRLGFRDSKDIADVTARDIVVVGDSFSFGWGVEEHERYSSLLESRLSIPVFNIAIPTDLEGYQRLVRYAQSHGATVGRLVIGICMENDLANYDRRAQALDEGSATRHGFSQFLSSAKAHLTDKSAAYNALSSAVHRNGALTDACVRMGLMQDSGLPARPNRIDAAVMDSSVERLVQLSREVEATLVIIPSRGLWVGAHQDAEREVHHQFVSRLIERGLNVIDMRPFMEQDGDPLAYHFKNDGHWNRQGHELAAKLIARRLNSRYE